MNICIHCGSEAKYMTKGGNHICQSSANKCPVIRLKNSESLKKKYSDPEYIETRKYIYSEESRRRQGWARGLTKETCKSLQKQGETYKSRIKSGHIIPSGKGRSPSLEIRRKMSESANERNNGYVKTEWYSIFCPSIDETVKVQGTWERAYATYLNDNNIPWIRGNKEHRMQYRIDGIDYDKTYIPDFYLPESNEYIEIKGFWWKSLDGRVDDRRKMNAVCECNKDKTIKILEKPQLKALGII
jgi:hypothetical protein